MCTCSEMGFQIKRSIVIERFLCGLLLGVLMVGHGTDTDVFCLSSIKESLEDPHDYFSSWKFNDVNICVFVGVECWQHGENKVLNLNLTNMGLKGEFPRGLRGCSSLVGLDLSHNELTGPIPSDISTLLPYATSIDLSNNKFNGEIPPSLANCSYLNSLRLDNNMLSGHIPQELGQLQRIRNISFANNNLSGPVPLFQPGLTCVDCYANNRELCGGPLPPCGSSDDFTETFKKGLAIGYAFSVTSVIVIYISYFAPWEQSESKHKTNYKAKEFRKYICSIAGRKTPTEPHTEQELQPLQLQEKAIKEVLFYPYHPPLDYPIRSCKYPNSSSGLSN